jgi:hypothetical protein
MLVRPDALDQSSRRELLAFTAVKVSCIALSELALRHSSLE